MVLKTVKEIQIEPVDCRDREQKGTKKKQIMFQTCGFLFLN